MLETTVQQMPQKYLRNLKWNTATKSFDVERINFGEVLTQGSGFSTNGAIGDSTSYYHYDGNLSIFITAKSIAIVPWTAEKGVLSLKSIWYLDDIEFDESSGELMSTSPSRVMTFTHYKSLESSFQHESGRSIVYPIGYEIKHKENVENEVILNGDRDADYFDFEFDSQGDYISGEYADKTRDKYNSSSRSSLLSEFGVSGNFEDGWWDSMSFVEIDSSGSRSLLIDASTWSETVSINLELTGTSSSGILQAKQVEKDNWTGPTGSLITGSSGNDIIRGLAGWDILDGGAGDDLIHGGNGRDVITGGTGSDELHGDFGWNTYKDQRDGSVDLIAIKSDQFLSNWWYGKAGNSPNGEKSDIIEGLDSTDQIKIIGVATSDLSFRDGISHKGVTGIGIYAKGVLEALYTGGDLSVSQISSMTTGDNSAQAMANQLWSYWGDNTVPALLD